MVRYMTVYFYPYGRLVNAIFRYFACSLFCIFYGHDYAVTYTMSSPTCDDKRFIEWMNNDMNNGSNRDIRATQNFCFGEYYQHDMIYRKHKGVLLKYMRNHSDHVIVSDRETVGDSHPPHFFIGELLYEPTGFSKIYDTAIHLRLDDFVMNGWFTRVQFMISMIDRLNLTTNSCIVVQPPSTDFERNYIDTIVRFVYQRFGVNITVESNDTLTDYYIMKNARVLVCSMSTLSWCAAFLSSKIEKCWFPNHSMPHGPHASCKYPIENTELYDIQ